MNRDFITKESDCLMINKREYLSQLSFNSSRIRQDKKIELDMKQEYSGRELYEMIHNLDWTALYRLSINDTWLDFIDHLNKLLVIYQDSKKHKTAIYTPLQFGFSTVTFKLIKKLYETAIDNLQKELLKSGAIIIDVTNLKDYSDRVFEHYLRYKSDYWEVIKEINDLMPALKTIIRSLDRKYKDSTNVLVQQGFNVNLLNND